MKKYILLIFILFSVNLASQDIKIFLEKDTIYEAPMYIPILETEQDSIRYGYKFLFDIDTIQNETTCIVEKPFIPKKVTRPSLPDSLLLKYINSRFEPVYTQKLKKKKKYEAGYTTIKFRISIVGQINDVEILRSSFPKYDQIIKEIIEKAPKYPPNSLAPEFYCLLSIRYPVRKNN